VTLAGTSGIIAAKINLTKNTICYKMKTKIKIPIKVLALLAGA